jgi:hypothetical protein
MTTINLAPTQASANDFLTVSETDGPQLPDGVKKARTSVASISQGIVVGTMIAKTNNDLVHVCDFAVEMKKNGYLKRFLIAQFAEIQKAIRDVLRTLAAGDLSGSLSSTANWLRGLANEILDFKRRILDPILDFTKEVASFVAWANAMIAYIKSLPARLYALLEECLLKIINAVSHILVDAFDTVPNPFTEVGQATKQVLSATASALNDVSKIVATTQYAAAGVNTLLNNTSKNNSSSVPKSLAIVSQPINASTAAAANTAVSFLTSSLPNSSNVAMQNTQSNASKKSTP